jgi:hypothetical protein
MWAKQGREVIFAETVLQSSGSGLYQTKIEVRMAKAKREKAPTRCHPLTPYALHSSQCIPVKKGTDFPLSFNMGIREMIGDEATHGKVIKIKGKKGGVR